MRTQSPRLELVSINKTFFEYFDLKQHGAHVAEFATALAADLSLDGLGPWLIFLKGSQTIIGDVGVKRRLDSQTLEVYVEIFPDYQGNHYGAEALIAYSQFATSKNIRYLVASVAETDLAAQRVFERAKFIRQETVAGVITYRYINFNWQDKIEDQQ